MNRETLNKLKNLLSVPTHTWEEDRLIEHVINYISSLDSVNYYQDKLGVSILLRRLFDLSLFGGSSGQCP